MPIVEAFAVPVVLKAVEFLFGEAQKMMEARRAAYNKPNPDVTPPPDIPLLAQDKSVVLSCKISAELAQMQQETIESILWQINRYEKNRLRLEQRIALEGGEDYAPLSVVNQLHVQEDAILKRSQELANLVNNLIKQAQ